MDRLRNISVIGNYLPRMCGIATFTYDLVTNLKKVSKGDTDIWAIAMNDKPEGYKYPKEVRFEINQNKPNEYKLASDFLNINQVDIVCLQHEYGIFGGADGSYIIQLIKDLRMPVISTLHTILDNPTKSQKEILQEIANISSKVVVMAKRAKEFLKDIYNIPDKKIAFIHHGIPDMPFVDPNYYKDQFGVEGKKVILTFGLLSPNKGIEYMIQALPYIVEKYPDTVYIILGATHPHIKKHSGESYRTELENLARKLGVDKNVMFFNQFVDIKELCEFLGAADIYVTPYLGEKQIVSGTLAYAMGVGKAIVSTPYWYAEEMLQEGRGVLVPFKNPNSMADAIINYFDNDIYRNSIRKQAYTFMRNAVWSQVASDYMSIFSEVKSERSVSVHSVYTGKTLEKQKTSLPDIDLRHLLTLTDDTGILQHAKYSVPDYSHGYCIDDNARALIVAVTAQKVLNEEELLINLQKKYLAFINYAFNEKTGRFRNFMGYDRNWLEDIGSEDSHGRALWGLGVCSAFSTDRNCIELSTQLFHKGLNSCHNMNSARSLAFALVGIHAYLTRFSGDTEARRIRAELAQKLFEKFKKANISDDWPWFEDILTYANAKIPQALLLSGQWLQNGDMLEIGFKALDWLIEIQTEDGHFSSIGCDGWYKRGGEKARFDQQPIEAQSMIETSLLAYRMSRDEKYLNAARMAFNWFLGENDISVPIYDYSTAGCRDGLQPDGPNLNQGAESTLAWLSSIISMQGFEADQKELQYVHEIEK